MRDDDRRSPSPGHATRFHGPDDFAVGERHPPYRNHPANRSLATMPIRMILADDHTLLRAGLRSLLHDVEGIEVVAEAGDGREALVRVETLQPHVLTTDIGMPGLNGIELTTPA